MKALHNRDTVRREAQRAALQMASPKRADSGRAIAQQQGEADLPLFAAAYQMSLF